MTLALAHIDLALLILGAWCLLSLLVGVGAGRAIRGRSTEPPSPQLDPEGLQSFITEERERREAAVARNRKRMATLESQRRYGRAS